MNDTISTSQVRGALRASVKALSEKRKELDRLDSPIGDGDHGRTISNAFQKIEPMIQASETDIGQLLKQIGRMLALSVGAAMGPLYGTGIMEAGKAVIGKQELSLADLAAMAKAFEGGVARRGKSGVGEKTMLDTIHPFSGALEAAASEHLPLMDALVQAREAAHKGMEATRDMISQRGRSSRLGERSRGHIDPGAASCYYIIEACIQHLAEAAKTG